MKSSKEVTRDSNLPDNEVMVKAKIFHNALEEDINDFNVKFPFFTPLYLSKFLDDIDAVKATEKDTDVVSDISLEVSVVVDNLSIGRDYYMTLMLYAHLAYPKNPAMINTFGHKNYEEYCTSHTLFPMLLDKAFRRANDPAIKQLLLAKGLTALDITNIDVISKLIQLESEKLEDDKSKRPTSTQKRIILINIVWATMKEISACSKDVYSDNYAKRHIYLLYPGAGGEETPPVPPVPPIIE